MTHIIVDAILSFVKAYRLKGDKNSLKVKICEPFSGDSIKKIALGFLCSSLRSLHLPYQQRRDSDKRKQLTADIEDLLLAFDAVDSNNSIPPIYCEAGELYKLPPISLDPLAEQDEKNSQVLNDLTSAVQCLESISKLSSCFLSTSNQSSEGHSPEQRAESNTYAGRVASFTPFPAAPLSSSHSIKASKSSQSIECDANLVLFGLPENHSLIEIVDEVLEFLAGKPVIIRDMFRLGKVNPTASSQSRPRPVLIKLSVAWDRKLVLLRKRNLQNFRTKRVTLLYLIRSTVLLFLSQCL